MRSSAAIVTTLLMLSAADASAARIKELTRVKGVRSNQLWGYGLVVGLAGTGDSRQALFTQQSVVALLQRSGIQVDPRSRTTNVAAVLVTAELPPFSVVGDKVDVVVSALGDARSLASGVLLMTPLKGADGNVYAVGQGPLVTGGFAIDTPLATQQRNIPTTARIALGANIERALPSRFVVDDKITLSLVEADFTTAQRIAAAINGSAGGDEIAKAQDPRRVLVAVPDDSKDSPVAFLAKIETLEVQPDLRARVVINERTGTVVVGGSVVLGPASVAHANLDVGINTSLGVSQPPAFSGGTTVVVPNTTVEAKEEKEKLYAIPKTTTVDDLVQALNQLGASPRDLMQILQALQRAGALRAEIEVM